ncbi:23S rRNA (guanine(745)-N(1))-methyltransferase [Rheinheimera sp.]|uniref:23S rRNA (guanine(745)-N(1))-methyltransferase n=1 Tax=Rheinheimera sp. TaxID=1869214 RepID=UPI00307D3D3A
MYRCPVCAQVLTPNPAGLGCVNRHQFDRAREGYVNLLPVQHKNSKVPGDSADMMQSRRLFLNAGHYQPLSDALNALLASAQPATLLDLGCGEGYYSNRLQQALPDTTVYGLDIAKTAVRYAAKAYPAVKYCVASAWHLPFADQSFDAVLKLCAPCEPLELARVSNKGATLLAVSAAPQHLVELKQQVYPQVRLHSEDIVQIPGFCHRHRQQLSYQLQALPAAELLALLDMTPLSWKFKPGQKHGFAATKPAISLDFYLDLYQKN